MIFTAAVAGVAAGWVAGSANAVAGAIGGGTVNAFGAAFVVAGS